MQFIVHHRVFLSILVIFSNLWYNLGDHFNYTQEKPIILHQGIYKPQASVAEAVFMITGMTIGAGILGLPYAVAQVGLWAGVVYIFVLGAVMLFLNLMVGEVAVRTKQNLQLPGLAGKYLGSWAKKILFALVAFSAAGALLAYVVGEGQTLAALFGGDPVVWGVVFWTLASIVVWRGLQTAKKVDKILSILVIAIVAGLSFCLLKNFNYALVPAFNPLKIFLPYGVILFALNATPAVIEAHALLPNSQRHFQRAVAIGTLIPIVCYVLFTVAVVGVMGGNVTEVATVGLGQKFGPAILVLANLFAAFAMGTGFIGVGIALKQTLVWDNKINEILATLIVILAPITLYFVGLRSFVAILDTVGGLFISIEAILMVLIFWRARKRGDLPASRYCLRHGLLIAALVLAVFTIFTVLSIMKVFN